MNLLYKGTGTEIQVLHCFDNKSQSNIAWATNEVFSNHANWNNDNYDQQHNYPIDFPSSIKLAHNTPVSEKY